MTGAQVFELSPHTAPPAAVEALEHAEDIRAARAALAEPGPNIPMSEVLAEHADDLAGDVLGHASELADLR